MLETLAGRTHEVVSGLCLLTPGWEEVAHETTRVTFRPLTPRDLAHYVREREWEGRAGAYAIQGLGAALVERIEGDYLNVVGLPAALLVRLLASASPASTASAERLEIRGFPGRALDSERPMGLRTTSTASAAATWPSTSAPRTRSSTCAAAASCSRAVVVAIDQRTGEVHAVGVEAKRMLGRTPGRSPRSARSRTA